MHDRIFGKWAVEVDALLPGKVARAPATTMIGIGIRPLHFGSPRVRVPLTKFENQTWKNEQPCGPQAKTALNLIIRPHCMHHFLAPQPTFVKIRSFASKDHIQTKLRLARLSRLPSFFNSKNQYYSFKVARRARRAKCG